MAFYKCGRIYTTQNSNVVVDTASGAIANFNTSLALPLKSLEIDVNAVQDLHGYDAPWIGGAGKNKCKPLDNPVTRSSGITVTPQADGSVILNGTQVGSSGTVIMAEMYIKQGITYIASIGNYDVNIIDFGIQGFGRDKRITYSRDFNSYGVQVFITEGTTVDNVRLYPQIEEGSTATSFEPYENICPIEGWNAITLDANGNTEVINLGGTYYGGHYTQDKDGHRQFEVTHEIADLATYTKTINKVGSGDNTYFRFNVSPYPKEDGVVVCDKFKQVVINTSTNEVGISIVKPSTINHSVITFRPENPSDYSTTTILDYIQSLGSLVVVYELAEPYIIDLPDGEPIITIVGTNNIYADTGDTSLQFRKIG